MNVEAMNQLVKAALGTVSEITLSFLEQALNDEVSLVYSFEFESGELSFDFLLVHSRGADLLDSGMVNEFFFEPLRQAISLADKSFEGRSFLFCVQVYEFEINTEYDSTSSLDQRSKPVMSSEIDLQPIR